MISDTKWPSATTHHFMKWRTRKRRNSSVFSTLYFASTSQSPCTETGTPRRPQSCWLLLRSVTRRSEAPASQNKRSSSGSKTNISFWSTTNRTSWRTVSGTNSSTNTLRSLGRLSISTRPCLATTRFNALIWCTRTATCPSDLNPRITPCSSRKRVSLITQMTRS